MGNTGKRKSHEVPSRRRRSRSVIYLITLSWYEIGFSSLESLLVRVSECFISAISTDMCTLFPLFQINLLFYFALALCLEVSGVLVR